MSGKVSPVPENTLYPDWLQQKKEIKNKRQGFTLLETLVVLTLLGLIVGSIVSLFNLTVSGLGEVDQEVVFQQELRTLEQKFRRDINSIFISSPVTGKEQDYFTGDYQKLSFQIIQENELKKVNYQFDPYQGNVFREVYKDNELEEKLIFFSELELTGLDFGYYDREQNFWRKNWEFNEKKLPLMIKMDLSADGKVLPALKQEVRVGQVYEI